MKIVLGSRSKSRKEILEDAGYDVEVMPSNFDEKSIRSADPEKLSRSLATAKMDTILPKLSRNVIVVTSDQIVSFNGEIHEKPVSEDGARRFMQTAHEHPQETFTAVEVANTASGARKSGLDRARVYFRKIPSSVVEAYIRTGEPMSHAGGFGIEHELIRPYIERIDGSADSIRGMPVTLTRRLIEEVTK